MFSRRKRWPHHCDFLPRMRWWWLCIRDRKNKTENNIIINIIRCYFETIAFHFMSLFLFSTIFKSVPFSPCSVARFIWGGQKKANNFQAIWKRKLFNRNDKRPLTTQMISSHFVPSITFLSRTCDSVDFYRLLWLHFISNVY